MQHFSHLLLMMNGMLQLLHFQMARLLDPQKSLTKCSNIWTQDHPTFSKISSQTVLHRDIWGECWENGPNRHLTKNFFLTLLDVDLVGEHFLLNIESILA